MGATGGAADGGVEGGADEAPLMSAPVLGAAFNLTLSAVGAGLLAFPYAFYESGLVLSVVIAAVFGVLNALVVWFLFHLFEAASRERAARGAPPVRTYEMLIGHYLGRRGYLAAKCGVLVGVIGSLIGYLVILGDIGHPVVQEFAGTGRWYASRQFIIAMFAMFVAFPLANLRSFKELAAASFIAILSVVVMVGVVVARGSQELDRHGGSLRDDVELFSPSGFFLTGSVAMFAYGSSVSSVAINAELAPSVRRRSTFVLTVAFVMCFVTYTVIGAFGYIRFGAKVKGDVLNNFSVHDHLASVGKLFMLLHVVLAYPVVMMPGRRVIRMWVFRRPDVPPEQVPLGEHTLQTLSVVLVTMGVAIVVPEVSVVFGMLGGSSFTLVTILLPALILYSPHCLGSPAGARAGSAAGDGVVTTPTGSRELGTMKDPLLGGHTRPSDSDGDGVDKDGMAAPVGVNVWPFCPSPGARRLARHATAATIVLGLAFAAFVTYSFASRQ